jgi:hypothetical protein
MRLLAESTRTGIPVEPTRSAGGESFAYSAESGETKLVFSEVSAKRMDEPSRPAGGE